MERRMRARFPSKAKVAQSLTVISHVFSQFDWLSDTLTATRLSRTVTSSLSA